MLSNPRSELGNGPLGWWHCFSHVAQQETEAQEPHHDTVRGRRGRIPGPWQVQEEPSARGRLAAEVAVALAPALSPWQGLARPSERWPGDPSACGPRHLEKPQPREPGRPRGSSSLNADREVEAAEAAGGRHLHPVAASSPREEPVQGNPTFTALIKAATDGADAGWRDAGKSCDTQVLFLL